MTSEQLWLTARRALGIYFVVTGLVGLPQILLQFGLEPGDRLSGLLPWTVLLQSSLALAAGWWLVRGAGIVPEAADGTSPHGALKIVLQMLGIYFLVGGAAALLEWSTTLVLARVSWEMFAGHFAEAFTRFAAGLLLVARPNAIAQRIAAFP